MKQKAEVETAGSLRISGKDVPVTTKLLEQSKLLFFAENPRVYSVLHGAGKAPAQEDIQARLQDMEHVRTLIVEIRQNDGLLEPLIVKDKTFEVLEGNSRLAAYRFLAKNAPVKWGMVKCTILPADIDESLVFALLGMFHIKGKKDWAPYEQAGFLSRRYNKHNQDLKKLAAEIGISSQKVKHLIDVYDFMVKYDEDVNRWSYFDEYLKSTKIGKAREKYPQMDDLVVEKIRSKEIKKAMDLRAYLPVIATTPRALTKFIAKAQTFEKAYESAVTQGGDNAHLNTTKRFRQFVIRKEVEESLLEMEGSARSTVIDELKKIELKIHHLLKKLQT
jgi:hypothetical protein